MSDAGTLANALRTTRSTPASQCVRKSPRRRSHLAKLSESYNESLSYHYGRMGRGCGDGRAGLGVGIGRGVGVGVAVGGGVGVIVGVAVGVMEGVGDGVCVGVGVNVGVAVALGVALGVAVGVASDWAGARI